MSIFKCGKISCINPCRVREETWANIHSRTWNSCKTKPTLLQNIAKINFFELHNTYTSSTKSSMFDNGGCCTKRRSPSCTRQTTRSTADHKIIEGFNCFRHHEAKRQAHLSRAFRPTPVCATPRAPDSRFSRSIWTEINRLEPVFWKNKMATNL